jgi:hypothetical protein
MRREEIVRNDFFPDKFGSFFNQKGLGKIGEVFFS